MLRPFGVLFLRKHGRAIGISPDSTVSGAAGPGEVLKTPKEGKLHAPRFPETRRRAEPLSGQKSGVPGPFDVPFDVNVAYAAPAPHCAMPQPRRTQERRVLPGKRIFRRRLFGQKRGPARGRPDRRIAASAAPPPPRGLRPPGTSPQTQKTPGVGAGFREVRPTTPTWHPVALTGPLRARVSGNTAFALHHPLCRPSPALPGAACAKLDSHSSHHGGKKNFSSNGPVSSKNGRFSGFHGTFFRVAKGQKVEKSQNKKKIPFRDRFKNCVEIRLESSSYQ